MILIVYMRKILPVPLLNYQRPFYRKPVEQMCMTVLSQVADFWEKHTEILIRILLNLL